MAKILSLLILVAMFVLLIPTGLVLASQDAVPGDATYPIKRKLEEFIINLASVHPATRAYFSVDFSNRRFTETTKLFARGDNEEAFKTLEELIEQSKSASTEVRSLHDQQRKLQLVNQLVKNLEDYDKQLEEIQTGAPVAAPSSGPTPTPTPVLVQVPQRRGAEVIIVVVTATPTPTPVVQTTRVTPTLPPSGQAPTTRPPTPTPRLATTTQPAAPAPGLSEEDRRKLDDAQKKLDDLRRQAEAEAESLKQLEQNSRSDSGFQKIDLPARNDAFARRTLVPSPTPTPVPRSGGRGSLEVEGPVRVATSCTPGVWDSTHCGVCNSDGVSWDECKDWGSGSNPDTWCRCAARCNMPSCQLNTTCVALNICEASNTAADGPDSGATIRTLGSCGSSCDSTRPCDGGQGLSCYDGECRLITNPQSVNCSAGTCNTSCDENRPCTGGLTCWGGECRSPSNPSDPSCNP